MITDNQKNIFDTELTIDEHSKSIINGIASWGMVIVVVSVIGYCFSIFEYANQPSLPENAGLFSENLITGRTTILQMFITISVGLVLNYFLYRFASSARSAISAINQQELADSFRHLKLYFITGIIILILTGIVFVISLNKL